MFMIAFILPVFVLLSLLLLIIFIGGFNFYNCPEVFSFCTLYSFVLPRSSSWLNSAIFDGYRQNIPWLPHKHPAKIIIFIGVAKIMKKVKNWHQRTIYYIVGDIYFLQE